MAISHLEMSQAELDAAKPGTPEYAAALAANQAAVAELESERVMSYFHKEIGLPVTTQLALGAATGPLAEASIVARAGFAFLGGFGVGEAIEGHTTSLSPQSFGEVRPLRESERGWHLLGSASSLLGLGAGQAKASIAEGKPLTSVTKPRASPKAGSAAAPKAIDPKLEPQGGQASVRPTSKRVASTRTDTPPAGADVLTPEARQPWKAPARRADRIIGEGGGPSMSTRREIEAMPDGSVRVTARPVVEPAATTGRSAPAPKAALPTKDVAVGMQDSVQRLAIQGQVSAASGKSPPVRTDPIPAEPMQREFPGLHKESAFFPPVYVGPTVKDPVPEGQGDIKAPGPEQPEKDPIGDQPVDEAKELAGKEKANVLHTYKKQNRVVEKNGQYWHVRKEDAPNSLPKRDPVGDFMQDAAWHYGDTWSPKDMTANERARSAADAAAGRWDLYYIHRAQARGRWVERKVKKEVRDRFPRLEWNKKGPDARDPATGTYYEIHSGTISNLDRHAKRKGMTDKTWRIISFWWTSK